MDIISPWEIVLFVFSKWVDCVGEENDGDASIGVNPKRRSRKPRMDKSVGADEPPA